MNSYILDSDQYKLPGRRRHPRELSLYSHMVAILVTAMLILVRFIDATTLEAQLVETYGDCYDPTGASCSCTGSIRLSAQGITGTIPAELSACTGITTLDLRSNALTGPIPLELSTMTSINEMNIRSNALTGTIPVELSTMTSTVELCVDPTSPRARARAPPSFFYHSSFSKYPRTAES